MIMILPSLILLCGSPLAHAAAVHVARQNPITIVQGNDDGWAVANIRALFDALNNNGFKSIISAPANQRSGTSSLDFPPLPLLLNAQFDSIIAPAPATGADPSDERINYVNSFPVTGVKHGIKTLAPKLLGGKPDLVVTGPNVGGNLGLVTQFSGTIGAATEAISQGIPAIAFSGEGGLQHLFTEPDAVAPVYAELALKVVRAVTTSKPFLPTEVALNVNFPLSDATTCTKASDFTFVLSRVNIDVNPFTKDVNHCGSEHLPTESSVIESGNCRVSISAFGTDKFDVDAATQAIVRDKLASLLTCLPA